MSGACLRCHVACVPFRVKAGVFNMASGALYKVALTTSLVILVPRPLPLLLCPTLDAGLLHWPIPLSGKLCLHVFTLHSPPSGLCCFCHPIQTGQSPPGTRSRCLIFLPATRCHLMRGILYLLICFVSVSTRRRRNSEAQRKFALLFFIADSLTTRTLPGT